MLIGQLANQREVEGRHTAAMYFFDHLIIAILRLLILVILLTTGTYVTCQSMVASE